MLRTTSRTCVVFVAAIALLAACGDTGEDAEPTAAGARPGQSTAAVSPAAPAATVPADLPLADALLTAEELGDGWESAPAATTGGENRLCDTTFILLDTQTTAIFRNPSAGRVFVIESISRLPPGQGPALFAALRQQAQTCREFTSISGDQQTIWGVLPATTFRTFGDETFALRAAAAVEGAAVNAEAYFVLVRRGDVVIAVADVYAGDTDRAQTEQIVERADSKLAQVAAR